MAWDDSHRRQRFYPSPKKDQRGDFERDRDRILYSSAFRRLTGVSQVVRAGEADVFHTRLAHTLKVGQIGRRLAQHLCREQPQLSRRLAVDPEVVEAACLAHDLGHPPFGHHGETTLNHLVLSKGDKDGYEGNAQAFRIVARLAVRFEDHDGLNLTRATLAAILKYPWMRDEKRPLKRQKWSAYSTEEDIFKFARDGCIKEAKTAEAEIMDWSDDIAYSVHDLEDFHRCRLIPWRGIVEDDDSRDALVKHALDTWGGRKPATAKRRLESAIERLFQRLFLPYAPSVISELYEGTREQRQQIRFITSRLVGRYIRAIKLKRPDSSGNCVEITASMQDEVRILKQITRDYVISNPALAAQQRGHGRVVEELFDDLYVDIKRGSPKYLPTKFKDLASVHGISYARAAADCISTLTEGEAMALHGRLRGYASGSVLDPIVR